MNTCGHFQNFVATLSTPRTWKLEFESLRTRLSSGSLYLFINYYYQFNLPLSASSLWIPACWLRCTYSLAFAESFKHHCNNGFYNNGKSLLCFLEMPIIFLSFVATYTANLKVSVWKFQDKTVIRILVVVHQLSDWLAILYRQA